MPPSNVTTSSLANSDGPGYLVEPLGLHDRTAFSCGVEELDRYFRTRVGQDVRKHVAACFVLVGRKDEAVIGYYTLSATAVALTSLPAGLAKKLPRYPDVPVTLLGRLALDRRYQGQGLGGLLLSDALKRSCRVVTEVASYAVVVDALDAAACRYYERYGFIRFPDSARRLFLPMRTIARLFDQ